MTTSTISVKDFGATGDGSTDDTIAIQSAIDSGSVIVFPDVDKFYRVTKPMLIGGTNQSGGKQLIGQRPCRGGFGVPLIQGTGGFPLFLVTGVSTQNRSIELQNLSAAQPSAPVLSTTFAINLSIQRCFFSSATNKLATVALSNSTYVSICESTLLCSGGGFALTAYNQCNKLSIVNNRITGGSIGGACHIEQSQCCEYRGNLTEIGVYGLVVGSGVRLDNPAAGNVNGAGASHGVTVDSNYFEDVQHAMVLGSSMNLPQAGIGQAIFGLNVRGNMMSVSSSDNPLITYGRVNGGTIQGNSFWRKSGGAAPAIRSTFKPTGAFAAITISQDNLTNGSGPLYGL